VTEESIKVLQKIRFIVKSIAKEVDAEIGKSNPDQALTDSQFAKVQTIIKIDQAIYQEFGESYEQRKGANEKD